MELCKDCGHKNIGAIYCVKCGSALFRRKARPERESVLLSLSRLWAFNPKRD